MEITQILIILGIIVFAVVKQLLKTKEEEPQQQPQTYVPEDYYTHHTDREPVKKSSDPYFTYDDRYSSHDEPIAKQQSSPPIQEEPEAEQEFNIHSDEEVRRGIIWSEILNRKY